MSSLMEVNNHHTVTVTIRGNTTHSGKQVALVEIGGDGSLDHILDAFKAALVAAGFSTVTAGKLEICDGNE